MTRIVRQLSKQQMENAVVGLGLIAGIAGVCLVLTGYTLEAGGMLILLAFAGGFSSGIYHEKRKERELNEK